MYTKQRKQLTTKTDKIVYKVVLFRDSVAYTRYAYEPIPYETLNGQKPFLAKGKSEKIRHGSGFIIGSGNIHTFAFAADAWKIANLQNNFGTPAVYECIIPKSTKYYYGKTLNKAISYASKQIRFVKRLQNPNAPKPIQTEMDLC